MEARPGSAHAGSAASWPAIIAGAFVAASVSLVLFALGAGLGLAETSPWPGHGATATTFAVTTAIWLIVMQWVSAAAGGYLTGRLRTRWHGTHTHEVFFRDTAHGLVTWAVATVLVAATLATSLYSALDSGVRAVPAMAPHDSRAWHQSHADRAAADEYSVDKLFRSTGPNTGGAASNEPRMEAGRIAANAARTGGMSDADRSYLAELVAARTGLPRADAQKRVDEFVADTLDMATKAKVRADTARKVAAEAAIYTALSMLVGAFIASVSAALGGRLRDEHI